ncbi:Panacea domain-containing protein [Agrobacterium sp. AGB01]|uniref:Panacea domain-containing protein n=1 Tax=Agrobacterium sp. AGB01 TaxID=2769302 RepID=UPI001FEE6D8F|nr:type II toxin-antitoxin system antitoxin SocA domain-containing protein [Agrobacterium sp. AGB01]
MGKLGENVRNSCEQTENEVIRAMYDVRAIANFVLDVAEKDGRDVSNLHINKIVYFLHADFLVAFSRPLVSAKIEAWTYGPVFRELYREFKQWGDAPIGSRAKYLDPETGQKKNAQWHFSKEEEEFLSELVSKYTSMTPGALVAQSHVEGGPWDQTWNHETKTNASMKISDEAIKGWYERTVKH